MSSEADLLREARERFDLAVSAEQENRENAVDDLRFLAGENQWPEAVKQERESQCRPCLVINRLPAFTEQVIGQCRQNRPAIKVRSTGDDPSPGVVEKNGNIHQIPLSDIYQQLVRGIETESNAEGAYDAALAGAVNCGRGAWRVVTEYSDDSAFEQDIRIKRIPNPFTVYLDPFYTEEDASDISWAFVSERMPRDEFERLYPDVSATDDFDAGIGDYDEWQASDYVRVAEYWRKVPITKTIHLLENGAVVDDGDLKALQKESPDIKPLKTRKVKSHKIVWHKITGSQILDGGAEGNDWPGKYIPIVPVFGRELNIENRRIYSSVIRNAKDPARLHNYWSSCVAENIALAPKSPYLVTTRQIEGLEDIWRSANTNPMPYLVYNPDPTVPGGAPSRQPLTAMDPALITERQQAIDDIKATTGIFDASMGNRSNEQTGKAILARRQQGDNATFTFPDNLAKAVRHCGRIIVDLIPHIYDTARVKRISSESGEEQDVRLNYTVIDPITGQETIINDLSQGKYDVTVTVGPAYATQRMESADSMLQFVQAVPQSAAVVSDLIAESMDWPKADVIAERLKRTIPPQILGPQDTPPEMQQQMQQQQQPPPDVQIKMAQEQAKLEGIQLDNELKKMKLVEQQAKMQMQMPMPMPMPPQMTGQPPQQMPPQMPEQMPPQMPPQLPQ